MQELQPEYYENFDLETVVTLVDIPKFVKLLEESNYKQEEIDFLEQGLKHGFDLHYEGPEVRKSESANIPFSIGNGTILWNKLMKEVKMKRVAGPYAYEEIPFENYIQSPISLVPKAGGEQTRLIFHLSFEFDENFKSVNYYTPKELCTVKYRDLDFAVKAYLQLQGYEMEDDSETYTDGKAILKNNKVGLERMWK